MRIRFTIQRHSLLVLFFITALAVTLISARTASPFPESISLPNGFRPEGIASGNGHTFFVGSLADGAIYQGDLVTGQGAELFPGEPGRISVGLKYDPRSHLLFVAGGPTGMAFIYDAETGAPQQPIQLTPPSNTFVNDVVITRQAAYFTDSMRPVFYRVPLDAKGVPLGTRQEIPLGGEFQFVAGFNANGIDAVPNDSLLIIVNSALGKLYTVDPTTGNATEIDLGGGSVVNGDGLLLLDETIYVVQNRLNQIAVVEVSDDFSSGEIVRLISSPLFDVPTTIAAFGDALYAVNARFTTTPTPDTTYTVVRVPQD